MADLGKRVPELPRYRQVIRIRHTSGLRSFENVPRRRTRGLRLMATGGRLGRVEFRKTG